MAALQVSNKLQHFLSCLDVPAVSQFRESPIYAEAGEIGDRVLLS